MVDSGAGVTDGPASDKDPRGSGQKRNSQVEAPRPRDFSVDPEMQGAPDSSFNDAFRQRFRWAWYVIWRGKHLILACLLLALVPTILFLRQAQPRYTAEALIMVETPEVRDALSDRNTRSWMNSSVITTEAKLVSSTILARRVVEKLQLELDPEFNAALREPKPLDNFFRSISPMAWIAWMTAPDPGDAAPMDPSATAEAKMAQIVRRFRGGLEVTPLRGSYVIVVRYTSENRQKAGRIANVIADTYVLDRLEAEFEEARRLSSWLSQRLEVLRQAVMVAEGAVEEYRAVHNLRRKGERQATLTDQQLSELNSRLVVARSELAAKQARLQQVNSLVRSRGSIETASVVLDSLLIQRLREQEAGLQRQMSEATNNYGERHPRMVGLRAELEGIRAKINSEIEKVAASLANDVEATQASVRTMERSLEGMRQQANVAGEAEVRLRELEREAEANRTLYEAFLSRFKRESDQDRMQRANARVISQADALPGKSYPRDFLVIILVAGLSLAGAVALVFLLDHLDNTIRSSEEAERLAGAPVLGMIPLQRSMDGEGMLDRPRSALADGVRSLRTSIDAGETERARIVVVSSSVPKEGKTFVSFCLALMFSQSEKRVLLIDADLHRPTMHGLVGVDGERGLAHLLRGEISFEDAVKRGAVGSLDFLPAGRMVNVTELLERPEMTTLLEGLLTQYDRIIIDSPPVLAVSDARVVARLADRLIFLVRWNSTPRDAVRNGLKLLRSVGIPVSGIVLSQVNQRKHARYGYGDYGQYYGRYREYYGE